MSELKHIRGAGGTEGGTGTFFIGLVMMVAGGYIFLQSIQVVNDFSMATRLYGRGGFAVTSGMVMFPFIFGIGMIFYNSRNYLGWFLTVGALVMLTFGVISNLNFRMRTMTAFELLSILVLLVGGIGLFLRSLHNFKLDDEGR